MRKPATHLWVHRHGKWEFIISDDLYPGDIILLSREKEEKPVVGQPRRMKMKPKSVPCDLLLLSGSAVVNEAILTGES